MNRRLTNDDMDHIKTMLQAEIKPLTPEEESMLDRFHRSRYPKHKSRTGQAVELMSVFVFAVTFLFMIIHQ